MSNAAILRWVGLILVIVLIALQLKLWVGGGGMAEVDSLRESVRKQTEENSGLQKRNQALAAGAHCWRRPARPPGRRFRPA